MDQSSLGQLQIPPGLLNNISMNLFMARVLNMTSPLATKNFNDDGNLSFDFKQASTPLTKFHPYLLNSSVSSSPSTPISTVGPQRIKRRVRNSGPANKTAEVWRFFTQVTEPDRQAATCNKCGKEIKATNSSTTGMIRHLKSCHPPEYAVLEHARGKQTLLKSINSLGQSDECTKKLQDLLKTNLPVQPESLSPSSTASSANATVASSICFSKDATNSADSSGIDSYNENFARADDQISVCASSANSDLFNFNVGEYKNVLKRNEDNAKALFGAEVKDEELENEEKPEDAEVEEKEDKKIKEHKSLNHHIAMMVVFGKLPEEIVENAGFKLLMRFLKPEYNLPSLTEFRDKIIPQVRNYMQKFIENNQTHWPISPSTTVESGFEEFENTSEGPCIAAQNRSLNMSFLSIPLKKEDDASSSVDSYSIAHSL
uniref:BED-type domain-containing protein n=2 Tax=Bursaphelenchus xylophilus TaxID=6326 RepID=A0A1I7RH70_BURXY